MEELNLSVRCGSKVPANDKNGLDWKNSWAGNYNSYLCQSQSVPEFYCCKRQKANMANVNQREFD